MSRLLNSSTALPLALSRIVHRLGRTLAFYFAVIAYLVALAGFVMGANAGYAADSLGEATVDRTEMPTITAEDVAEQDSAREEMLDGVIPGDSSAAILNGPDWFRAGVNERVAAVTNLMVWLSVSVANASGAFFYSNQWIPRIIPQALGYLGQLPLFAGVGYYVWRRVKVFR